MEFHPPVIGNMRNMIENFDGIGRHWQLTLGSGGQIKSIFFSINSFSNFEDFTKCFGMCKLDTSTQPSAKLYILVSNKKEYMSTSNLQFWELGHN